MDEEKSYCRYCFYFFRALGRDCTKEVYLECDCPKCQGLCECEEGIDARQVYKANRVNMDLPSRG
jgi:hypothetical protein